MLRIRVLGRLEVERDGSAQDLPATARARSLLAWLAVHPGVHPRSELAGRLRPDVLDESARKSLRQAAWSLKQALGPGPDAPLEAVRDRLGLAQHPRVWVDLTEFQRLRTGGALEQALELCRGELLEGLDDEWVYVVREEHRAERAAVLSELAERAEAAGDWTGAVAYTRRAATEDPLAETPHRELMRRLAAAGDRSAALAVYASLRERLRRELTIAPSAQTRALAEEVRTGGGPPQATGPPSPTPAGGAARTAAARPAAELVRPPSARPFPEALARDVTLVGRADALERLVEPWSDALAGTTRIVCLAGEPGIGKTTLAAHHARRVHDEGGVALYGRCDEKALVSYQPFVEALAGHIAAQPTDWRAALVERRPELALLLPGLDGAAGRAATPAPGEASEAAGERYRAFEAVRELLGLMATTRPVVLVLDDLHWADPPTLLLLRHLGRTLRRARLLVLGAYRDTEVADDHPLTHTLADLRREHPLRTTSLDGLDGDAIVELVRERGFTQDAAGLAIALLDRSQGNPFFVEELLRELEEREPAPGASVSLGGVPPGVKGLIGHRLRRLAPEAVATLRIAALLGQEFELADLEAALAPAPGRDAQPPGPAGSAVLDGLEQAVRAGLLAEAADGERHLFAHALVRDALQESLSAARRRRTHLQIGAALERRQDDAGAVEPAKIASHLLAALPAGDLDHAIDWAMRAGRRAMSMLAFEDAAGHYGRALAALRGGGRGAALEGELLIALGDAHQRAGAPGRAADAFAQAAQRARANGDGDLLARAALGAGGLAVVVTDVDPSLAALLREALERVGDAPSATRARLLARLAVEVCYADGAAADRLSSQAVRVARGLDADPATGALALTARRAAIWSPERAGERLDVASEIVDLARRAGDREAELHGRNWRVLDLLELGRVDAVAEEVDAFARLADAVGLPHHRWYVPLWRAALAILEGRFADADRLRARAAAIGREGQDPNVENFVSIQAVTSLLEQRRFAEIDVEALLVASDRPFHRRAWAPTLAVVHLELGRVEAGRALFEEVAAGDFATLPAGPNWHVLVDAAEACALLGDASRARRLYAMLRPHARLFPVVARAVGCMGSAELSLGRLAGAAGRADEAIGHFERGLEANARIGARPRAALTGWRLAEALAGRDAPGDRDRATALAGAALADAERLGMEPFARDLRDLTPGGAESRPPARRQHRDMSGR